MSPVAAVPPLGHEYNSIVPAIEPPVLLSTTLIDLPFLHIHINGPPLNIEMGIILSSLLICFLVYNSSHSVAQIEVGLLI